MSNSNSLLNALTAADSTLLGGILRGIEKESLRVSAEGVLAQSEHPRALGSALTHPNITTDYSEALLEFITQPHASIDELLQQLDEVHRFTYQSLSSQETLWGASMPCMLTADEDIPVARYGNSTSGQMKTIYRLGLGHRYGRSMQTIAGIHYNFSLPDSLWQWLHSQQQSSLSLQDFKTQRYFDLIRNFRRYSWLLVYLFGAAPAVCRSFVRGRQHSLEPLGDDDHSLHTPYATSLRMGDLGYQSDAQKSLVVCYNNLSNYLKTLCGAITQPIDDYRAIGLKGADGQYQQLNTSLLQIENEFYSSIRPKRTAQPGETALSALQKHGVEYIEVRCLDLNPYLPLGINAEQIRVVDSFLLYCLLSDSPASDVDEYQRIQENQSRIVYRGRDPQLTLLGPEGEVSMAQWSAELLAGMGEAAALLDGSHGQTDGASFSAAVAKQQAKLGDSSQTPSAQLLADMQSQQQTFFRLAMQLSERHKQHFSESSLSTERQQHYRYMAEQSLQRQSQIEAQPQPPMDEYLADYYRQYQDCGCV